MNTQNSKTPLHYPITYHNLLKLIALTFVVLIGSTMPAQAVQFDFSYAPGTSLEQMIGIEMAGGIWSNYLVDNVTVQVYVEMTDTLPPNVVGGALPGLEANRNYDQFEKSYSQDVTSIDDQAGLNKLQKTKDFDVMVNGNIVGNNKQVSLTRANAKALGLIPASDNKNIDGYIIISNLKNQSSSWNYDFLRSNVAANNTLDFLSEGLHEIGHVLGFVSGVDKPGWLDYSTGKQPKRPPALKDLKNVTPLDMSRYSTGSAAAGLPDISIGGGAFFSIDGVTSLALLATGEKTSLGGDGYQASHWQHQTSSLGIMDPVLTAGARPTILPLDLRSLDVIGWKVQQAGIDLVSLQAQAKQRLAQKLGITTALLDANPVTAALALTEDRSKDVQKMITQSQIYKWGFGTLAWGQGWWQEAFFENAYFTTVGSQEVAARKPVVIVLGMGLLATTLLKLRGKRARKRLRRVRYASSAHR